MFKSDLSSEYHHIDLHASMYKYFGFSWDNCFMYFLVWFIMSTIYFYKDPKEFSKILERTRYLYHCLFR